MYVNQIIKCVARKAARHGPGQLDVHGSYCVRRQRKPFEKGTHVTGLSLPFALSFLLAWNTDTISEVEAAIL